MRILVIGGTGNISRWFVPKLLEKGFNVTLFNRGSRQMPFTEKCTIINGDRTDHNAFENHFRGIKHYDCVIDMIGFEPEEATTALRVFKNRVGQYIFCSTVDVFTKQPHSYPICENGDVNASPTFPYAYKKMQMENIFRTAFESDQFPVTVIRPAATYSEGWSPLVTCFGGQTYHLDRLKKGMPMILQGDGTAIWVATHSEDVANVFVNAVGNTKAIGRSYNVTGDELMTWEQMHRTIAAEINAPEPVFEKIPTSILQHLAPIESEWCRENFQFNNIFNSSLAKEELGFRYTISYKQGARRCIRYLEDNNLIESSNSHKFYDEVIDKWRLMKTKLL